MRLCHMRDYLYKFRILLISVKAGKIRFPLSYFYIVCAYNNG